MTAPARASTSNTTKTETEAIEARSETSRLSPPKPGPSAAVNSDLPPSKIVDSTSAGPDRGETGLPAPKAPENEAAKPVKRSDDAIGGIMTRIGLAVRHKASSGETPTVTKVDPATDSASPKSAPSGATPSGVTPSGATPSGATNDRDQESVRADSNPGATPPRGETIAEIMARVAEQVYSSHEAAARKAASETAGPRYGTGQAGNIGSERVTDGPAEPQDLTPHASFA